MSYVILYSCSVEFVLKFASMAKSCGVEFLDNLSGIEETI